MLVLILLTGYILEMFFEIFLFHRFLVLLDLLGVELLEGLVGKIEVEVAGGGGLEL